MGAHAYGSPSALGARGIAQFEVAGNVAKLAALASANGSVRDGSHLVRQDQKGLLSHTSCVVGSKVALNRVSGAIARACALMIIGHCPGIESKNSRPTQTPVSALSTSRLRRDPSSLADELL
jgi:hypothetical protein